MSEKEIDSVSGVETTGHSWDGIKELNNPLPRWWVWTFYATVIWSIGYMIYYPAIPLIEGSTMGISGQTNRSVLEQELGAIEAERSEIVARIDASSLEEIQANDELNRFAMAGGASLFKVHCSQCHGSGAAGGPGYPNLNDDEWLWGGDLDAIYHTITHGVRNEEADEARFSDMPAYGTDELLDNDQIAAVAEYVLQLSGQEHDAELAAAGAETFELECSACHGENGEGLSDLGAPNLANAIWLFGGSREEIIAQINAPQHGVMPPWGARLGSASVKQLSLYVHGLGGGQ